VTIAKTGVALVDCDEQGFLHERARLKIDFYFEGSLFRSEVEVEGVLLLVGSEEGLQLLQVIAVAL
jgi:hypothetical protein